MPQLQRSKNLKKNLLKRRDKQVRIIEVFTDRQVNVKAHRELWNEITERLDSNE